MKTKKHSIMKVFRFLSLALVSCATLSLSQAAAAQTEQDALALVRSLIQADRQAVVAETLQLTDTESRAFWPLYHQYRAEMDKLGDRLLNAVQEYAAAYPEIPADQAKKLLRELNDVEKKRVSTRTAYLKKFGKVLPADRNLRLAQVERRLDIVLALEMANEIPLVPVEGELTGEAIDAVQRTATLRFIDGTSETFTVRDDIDLGQRKVGEQVVFSVVERIALEIEPSP